MMFFVLADDFDDGEEFLVGERKSLPAAQKIADRYSGSSWRIIEGTVVRSFALSDEEDEDE